MGMEEECCKHDIFRLFKLFDELFGTKTLDHSKFIYRNKFVCCLGILIFYLFIKVVSFLK